MKVQAESGRHVRPLNKEGRETILSITIEAANDTASIDAASCIREQVFGKAYYRRLPDLTDYGTQQILTLLARVADTSEPIAVLSVVETTGDSVLHGFFELSFPNDTLVARYTQLAVLKAYRGMHVPTSMILEARRRFVLPKGIAYSWLLFDADTARSCSFCTSLGFKASRRVFATEYGRSRVLVRREQFDSALTSGANFSNRNEFPHMTNLPNLFPRVLFEDEWLSQ